MDRLLLLKPPKGIPDPEYDDGEAMILARVPIYGTTDAGCKFWSKFRKVIIDAGFRECKIAKATYVLEYDNDIKCILITHVDDLCWASKEGYEGPIQKVLEEFVVKKVEEMKFRFCGKAIEQQDDMSVKVTCKDAIENVGYVTYEKRNRKAHDKASDAEKHR